MTEAELKSILENGESAWLELTESQNNEERTLTEKRVSHANTFDAQPCFESALEDLDLAVFPEYQRLAIDPQILEENHRPITQQLASLRLYDLKNDCPTHGGILLFGKNVRYYLSGAYIQFLQVEGDTLADTVLQEREIAGDLQSVLRRLDDLLESMVAQYPVSVSLLREQTLAAYPKIALREMAMNAVMHRNYESTAPIRITWLSDRIEIQSPGGLYGEASQENFPTQTSYRNPIIAEAMKTLGYLNRYGAGVRRAEEAMLKNGSPPLEFRFDAGYVLATLRRREH